MTLYPDQLDPIFEATSETRWSLAILQDLYAKIEALATEVVALRSTSGPYCYPLVYGGGSAIKKGFAVALRHTGNDSGVVLATTANISSGAHFLGVAVEDGVAGGRIKVQTSGVVTKDITGITSGASTWCKVNGTTGALERDSTIVAGDMPIGSVNQDGDLALLPVDFSRAPSVGGNTAVGFVNSALYYVGSSSGPQIKTGGDATAAVLPEGSIYLQNDGAVFASDGNNFAPIQQARVTTVDLTNDYALNLSETLTTMVLKVGPVGVGKFLSGPDLSSAYWSTKSIVMIMHNNGANSFDVVDYNGNNSVSVPSGQIRVVLFYNDYVYDIT